MYVLEMDFRCSNIRERFHQFRVKRSRDESVNGMESSRNAGRCFSWRKMTSSLASRKWTLAKLSTEFWCPAAGGQSRELKMNLKTRRDGNREKKMKRNGGWEV